MIFWLLFSPLPELGWEAGGLGSCLQTTWLDLVRTYFPIWEMWMIRVGHNPNKPLPFFHLLSYPLTHSSEGMLEEEAVGRSLDSLRLGVGDTHVSPRPPGVAVPLRKKRLAAGSGKIIEP